MKYAPLLALIALVSFAGCSGGGDKVNVGNGINNTIVGRWSANTIQAPNSVAQNCPTSVTVAGTQYACGLVDTQVFHDGGAYDEVIGSQRGTWRTNGNTLTVSVPGQPDVVYTYSISDDGSTLHCSLRQAAVPSSLHSNDSRSSQHSALRDVGCPGPRGMHPVHRRALQVKAETDNAISSHG